MTDGISLRIWEEAGMFEREVALYRRLRPYLRALTIVTYGPRPPPPAGRACRASASSATAASGRRATGTGSPGGCPASGGVRRW